MPILIVHISLFAWFLLGCAHADTSAQKGVWLFSERDGNGRAYFAPQAHLPFDICHCRAVSPHDTAKYFATHSGSTESALTLWDPGRGSQVHSARVVGGCAGLYRAHCFECWDYGEAKKKQMFLGDFCESSGIVNTGDGYGGLHHIDNFRASTDTQLLSPEALDGWRIRVSANTTRSGWAWDVQELRFFTASGPLMGCSPIHSGSVSDKEKGGIAGYEPECALTERRCRWGGRKDRAGMFFLGLQCKEQHHVTKVVINQPSSTHYADNMMVEISQNGGQSWKVVSSEHTTQVDGSTSVFVANASSQMLLTTAVMTTKPTPLTYGGSVNMEQLKWWFGEYGGSVFGGHMVVRFAAQGATQTQMELVAQKALAIEFGVVAFAVAVAAVESRRLSEATATKSGNWVVSFNVTFPAATASVLDKVRHTVSALQANTATLALKMKTGLKAAGAAASVYDTIEVYSFLAAKADGMESNTAGKAYASTIAEDVAISTSAPYVQQNPQPLDLRAGMNGISGARSMYVMSAGAVLAFAVRLGAP